MRRVLTYELRASLDFLGDRPLGLITGCCVATLPVSETKTVATLSGDALKGQFMDPSRNPNLWKYGERAGHFAPDRCIALLDPNELMII